jgi:multidrug efflux pump subunit AcrA (membrane-fusion protein)
MSQVVISPPKGSSASGTREDNQTHGRKRLTRLLALSLANLPALLIFTTFGALFYYGHHSGWQLPKFSALNGHEAEARADWCEEHNVPESKCVECNADLMPKEPDYGWCAEHGVHNCPLHHPDVSQLKEVPSVSATDFERAHRALALRKRPENNAACQVYKRRIQFASVETVQQAGVDVELVERRPIEESVFGSGEITFDATRLASLSSRVPGSAWMVLKNVGEPVNEGEVLAIIDAMEVGRAKSDLVKAIVAEELSRKTLDRLSGLTNGVVAGRQILEAEAEFAQAEAEVLSASQALANLGLAVEIKSLRGISKTALVDRLRFLGLPAELVSQISSQTTTANLLPVRSPLQGVVIDRQVVAGEVVTPSQTLFRVVDPSRMWLTFSIPLEQASLLSVGQPVRFRPDGSQEEVTGQLAWVSAAADKQTRMVEARAELPNPDGHLRDETFGAGRVILREEQDAIVVPSEAIHWEGCCNVVFVRDKRYFDSPDSPKLFHVRSVRPGATSGKFTEIIAGVLPGEVVTTKGSDVLRAQLLKNNLGEGCACVAE